MSILISLLVPAAMLAHQQAQGQMSYGLAGTAPGLEDLLYDSVDAVMTGAYDAAEALWRAATDAAIATTVAILAAELTRQQCKYLQEWCIYFGGWDCFNALQNCRHNGRWDYKRWPLPPEATPDGPPPGF